MAWCQCEDPQIKEGRMVLRKGDKCIKCGRKIKKYYKTRNGPPQAMRVAQEEHECRGCNQIIEIGDLYFQMTVDGDDWQKHTWALCVGCCRKRGDMILDD